MRTIIKKILSVLIVILILLNLINIDVVKADEGVRMVANCIRQLDKSLGDTSGNEYKVMNWYNNGWEYVFRYPDARVAEKIAQLAVEAASNNHIGYSNDLSTRLTFWNELQANNYSPAAITKDCASDCSGTSGMIVRAAGYQLNVDEIKQVPIYGPRDMPGNFENCGFQAFRGSEYTNSSNLLQPGDVLCSISKNHATIYVGDPANIKVTSSGPKLQMKGTKLADCSIGEGNRVTGGQAGDQNGYEYRVKEYYDKGWSHVLRYPDQKVAAAIAIIAINAANNDNVGYDQGQRLTYWQQLEANNYDASKISVPCEADCSSAVSAAVRGAGFVTNNEEVKAISEANWTGSMVTDFTAHGFKIMGAECLHGTENLIAGDVLLNSRTCNSFCWKW